jgi:hypothetical protein
MTKNKTNDPATKGCRFDFSHADPHKKPCGGYEVPRISSGAQSCLPQVLYLRLGVQKTALSALHYHSLSRWSAPRVGAGYEVRDISPDAWSCLPQVLYLRLGVQKTALSALHYLFLSREIQMYPLRGASHQLGRTVVLASGIIPSVGSPKNSLERASPNA